MRIPPLLYCLNSFIIFLWQQLQSTIEKKSEEEEKAIAVNKKHKDLNRAGADIPGNVMENGSEINSE